MTEKRDMNTFDAKPRPAADDAVIIKAFHGLKIKTGPGGFDAMNVKKAERRLDAAVHLFPQVAAGDLALIEERLAALDSGDQQPVSAQQQTQHLHDVLSSVVELKAYSTMFSFPLVTEILNSLLPFCLSLKMLTPLARDVITEHLRALQIAIQQGAHAITPDDHQQLLSGLEQAVAKVLKRQ